MKQPNPAPKTSKPDFSPPGQGVKKCKHCGKPVTKPACDAYLAELDAAPSADRSSPVRTLISECCHVNVSADKRFCPKCGYECRLLTSLRQEPFAMNRWEPIETAPRIHPLNGGESFLLAWIAPGIGEWIMVVGVWRDGWHYGEHKAYPTHWKRITPPGINS